jgi:phosphoribosylanthranilate isomerase
MRIKICGITNLGDALFAVELGASALGFNFYPKSPRYITPDKAADIIKDLPSHIATVGIFVNPTFDDVRASIDASHIQIAQLHGDESITFCWDINVPVIKAIRPNTEADLEKAKLFSTLFGLLIDAPNEKQYGGTGQRANWPLASKIAAEYPIYLAGGLNTDNVIDAITKVNPYGIDICSGVESRPGCKSQEKMKKLFHILKYRGYNHE